METGSALLDGTGEAMASDEPEEGQGGGDGKRRLLLQGGLACGFPARIVGVEGAAR